MEREKPNRKVKVYSPQDIDKLYPVGLLDFQLSTGSWGRGGGDKFIHRSARGVFIRSQIEYDGEYRD